LRLALGHTSCAASSPLSPPMNLNETSNAPQPAGQSISSGRSQSWKRQAALGAAVVIFLIATAIRFLAPVGFKNVGFDEVLYRDNIVRLDYRTVGILNYPVLCEHYLEDQRKPETITKLPPTRFLYIFCGWITKRMVFGDAGPVNLWSPDGVDRDPALVSLHHVSRWFSIFTVALAGLAAWRMAGPAIGLGVMTLVATSPIAIHMGAHALIDGFFAFWATLSLWLLWENLQRPNRVGWLAAFAASLAVMVITKENSFFVYVALCGVLGLNRWWKFGAVTPRLLVATAFGPAVGAAILMLLAGGPGPLVEIYATLVKKAQKLDFAIMTGDGPWYRYLIDLLIEDPIVFVLALTGISSLPKQSRVFGYLLAFVVISYTIMCNVRYGMNLRYTTIWTLALAAMASAQLVAVGQRAGRGAIIATVALFLGLGAYNLRQYQTFFAKHELYETVPEGMLRALDVIKDPPPRGEPRQRP
jgi:hypothetical protein